MFLLITESIHLICSLIIGYIVYKYYYKSYWVFVFAILGGRLIDADHLIDFWLAYPFSLDVLLFLKGTNFEYTGKAFLFLHAWELSILGIVLSYFIKTKVKYLVLVFSVSLFVHLWVDVFTNKAYIMGYSIIYRYVHNFDLKYLCKENK